MRPSSAIDDFSEHLALGDERALARGAAGPEHRHPAPPTPELDERLLDHLRPERVLAARRTALEAPQGSSGEPARREFRALAGPWLERAAAEPAEEIAARASRLGPADDEREARLAATEDPRERERLYREWVAAERALRSATEAWRSMREAAAAQAGATSVAEFLAPAHPVPPATLIAPFEHGAIAPLDELVGREVRERRGRYATCCGRASREEADAPLLSGLCPHRLRPATEEIPRVLHRLAAALGRRPGAGEAAVVTDARVGLRPRVLLDRNVRSHLALGSLRGPGALRGALGAYGVALRCGFVAERRGPVAARYADPAFGHAAECLFRRLVLCPVFREWMGMDCDIDLERDLWVQESVAPRRAWAYLSLVSPGSDPRDDSVGETLARCCGVPPTPRDREIVARSDPEAGAELRGTVLGLLLEERLRSRFDRDWFRRSGARRFLDEIWEAEPSYTAEEMARTSGLGTIEPTPLLDACRPRGR